jgi:hypothetical protein
LREIADRGADGSLASTYDAHRGKSPDEGLVGDINQKQFLGRRKGTTFNPSQ